MIKSKLILLPCKFCGRPIGDGYVYHVEGEFICCDCRDGSRLMTVIDGELWESGGAE